MARQLLKDDGSYDRAAIVRRANHELRLARRIGLEWARAHCLAYVWDRRGRCAPSSLAVRSRLSGARLRASRRPSCENALRKPSRPGDRE